MVNPLFGPWPNVPHAEDAHFVEPPLGELCLTCNEPIREGEAGEIMPMIAEEGTTLHPVHRECLILRIIGHNFGVCSCTNYAGTSSLREAALELDRRVIGLRTTVEQDVGTDPTIIALRKTMLSRK